MEVCGPIYDYNEAAKPFRMMASGNSEKLNRELIACFVEPWK